MQVEHASRDALKRRSQRPGGSAGGWSHHEWKCRGVHRHCRSHALVALSPQPGACHSWVQGPGLHGSRRSEGEAQFISGSLRAPTAQALACCCWCKHAATGHFAPSQPRPAHPTDNLPLQVQIVRAGRLQRGDSSLRVMRAGSAPVPAAGLKGTSLSPLPSNLVALIGNVSVDPRMGGFLAAGLLPQPKPNPTLGLEKAP